MADGLASQVIQGAQQTADSAGHTVGDALQAYHIASTAENARQELEMEKSNHDMNRMNWVAQQVKAIQSTTGPARQMLGDAFAKQYAKVVPEGNQDFPNLVTKDPEFGQNTYQSLANFNNGTATADDVKNKINFLGMATPDQISGVEKDAQNAATVRAGQAKASGMEGRVDVMKQNAANGFANHVDNDSILKLSRNNLNSLDRSTSILNKPSDQPVTSKDLNLAYNDYINAVSAGGAATEGKIARELPETFEQKLNEIKQKFGDNSDLRSDPSGRALISLLSKNISTVKGDISNAVSDRANDYFNSGINSPNPYVQNMAKQKLQHYDVAGKYTAAYGGAAPTPQAAPAAAAPATQANPDDAKIHPDVQQNGHVYKWNPDTRKYE